MKHLLTILFVSFLFISNSFTQDTHQEEDADLWALQFQIASNFTLSSFNGSTISLKRKLSDDSSLRFGVSLNSSIFDSDFEGNPSYNEGYNFENDNTETNYSIGLSLLYLWNTTIKNDISAYYGLGPSIGFGYNKNKQEDTNASPYDVTSTALTYTSNNFGFGVIGAFGIEWFVKENISILGEYGASITYNFQSEKWNRNQTNNSNSVNRSEKRNADYFRFSSLSAKLGVSIYF